jgi:RHS repeat-associated protein
MGYSFGMLMPGKSYSATGKYRYGFNGKENDNEVKSEGGQQDYGMRMYDPRLGKFLSVDPITKDYPWYTPYQFAGNKPIEAIDLDGAEEYYINQQNANAKWLLFQREEKVRHEEFREHKRKFPLANLPMGPPPQSVGRIPTRDEVENGRERLAKQEAARHAESVKPKNLLKKVGQAAIDIVETPFREAVEFRQAVDAGDVGGAIKHGFNFGLSVAAFVGPLKIGRPIAGGISTATEGMAPTIAKGSTYSVAFEMNLASTSYPGVYRGAHFLEANKTLNAAMAADKGFASNMTNLGITIPRSATGAIEGRSPKNWVWHHDANVGVMQLVPKPQHTSGSIFWKTLHPGGVGGFAIWGK